MQMDIPPRFSYGIKDACEATGLGRSFLYQKISAGELPIFKIGSRTLIASDDLQEFIQRHRRQS
jgi:excisionase family DNA binding protein